MPATAGTRRPTSAGWRRGTQPAGICARGTTSATGSARDYLGIGVGAVSTIENRRWRNAPSLARYVAALARGERPPRELEELPAEVRATERLMLGLRLDEPLPLAGLEAVVDADELRRLAGLGLAEPGDGSLALTTRGRFLGGGVTARLLA